MDPQRALVHFEVGNQVDFTLSCSDRGCCSAEVQRSHRRIRAKHESEEGSINFYLPPAFLFSRLPVNLALQKMPRWLAPRAAGVASLPL